MVQGGDIVSGNGLGGECVYGGQFDDESLLGVHDRPGVVSMANAGRNVNGSQFFITTCAAPHLDKSHVVVGRVIAGMEIVRQVERCAVDGDDRPIEPVLIDDCGCECSPIPHVAVPLSQHPPSAAEREKRAVLNERRARREREQAEIDDEDEEVAREEINKMVQLRDEKRAAAAAVEAGGAPDPE